MSGKLTTDSFFTVNACDNERHTFPCLRQKNMYRKLHNKRCEICRNASTTTIYTEVRHIAGDRSSYQLALENQTIQEYQQVGTIRG
jgi:hypothetical protein